MAELSSFMIYDSSNQTRTPNGEVIALVSPQLVLRPQYVPGNFSFGIAVGMSGIDLSSKNRMKLIIKDPADIIIYNSEEQELPSETKKDSLPEKYQGFIACVDIRNLSISQEGEYPFSFYLNNELVETRNVPIFRRE